MGNLGRHLFLVLFLALANVDSQIIEDITEEEKLALRELKNANIALSSLNGWNTTQFDNTTLYCGWTGVLCGDRGIVHLVLNGRGLVSIPPSVYSNFREMLVFRVNDNPLTQATLPSQNVNIGKGRPTFNFFDMQRTRLTGSIPPAFMLNNVQFMYLNENGLTGSIPEEIGNMQTLWELNLGSNGLVGTIPQSISLLKELQTLNISNNRLLGQLPAAMANLTQLSILDLSNNLLTGPIPDFKFSPQIRTVMLQGNQFDSLVPSFLTSFTGTANFTGVSFRCPIPPCSGGVACVLSGLQCYCPCNDTGGGECVLDTLECKCNPYRFGPRCNSVCVGTVGVNGVLKPCSGHGTCRNGPTGDGQCICDIGYGGPDCAVECPKARNQTCGGYGTCLSTGECLCNPFRTGMACLQCAVGYAGPECAIECRRHEDRICNDQGDCNDLGECDCLGGYFGTSCEFAPEESSVNGWLVVGSILIILFVVAVAALAVGGYYFYKKRKDYEELESKYAQNEVDREMDEFRSKRDENDASFSGIMAKKKTLQLDQI